ncbi:hypothetical protein LTS18_012166 [Coniosporium uncinatum]|uniref:Uncharacterized protein n=1 Tax=Coniosporium uncinatum TaxID=93489 RepID=A0ACC3DVR1_9PEZI|nr:hypothetical protein LTS18_012166 [Coniosporium uncinatum]
MTPASVAQPTYTTTTTSSSSTPTYSPTKGKQPIYHAASPSPQRPSWYGAVQPTTTCTTAYRQAAYTTMASREAGGKPDRRRQNHNGTSAWEGGAAYGHYMGDKAQGRETREASWWGRRS